MFTMILEEDYEELDEVQLITINGGTCTKSTPVTTTQGGDNPPPPTPPTGGGNGGSGGGGTTTTSGTCTATIPPANPPEDKDNGNGDGNGNGEPIPQPDDGSETYLPEANLNDENGHLQGTLDDFIDNINSLVGDDYVWGGNDPEADGGVDCSGAILWALNQEGNDLEDQTADDIYNNEDIVTHIDEEDVQPGDLRFLDYDGDGTMDHVQVMLDTEGSRFNPTGGPENTIDNPGTIQILPGPIYGGGEYGRLNFQ